MRAALIHFSESTTAHRTGTGFRTSFGLASAGSFLCSIIGSAITFFFLFYIHHVCTYSRWCVRWGHTPMAGGRGRVCHRHHPDHEPGTPRLRGGALHAAHFEWLDRQ